MYLPMEKLKRSSSVSFERKRDTGRKNVLNLRFRLKRKVINYFLFVMNPICMVDVCHNTWLIDFGSAIHIMNSLQGLENLGKPMGSKRYIYSRNKISSLVRAIWDI